MAVLRQSLLSIGYVLLILPQLKEAADVLKQNILGQNKAQIEVETAIGELHDQLALIKNRNEKAAADLDRQDLNKDTQSKECPIDATNEEILEAEEKKK